MSISKRQVEILLDKLISELDKHEKKNVFEYVSIKNANHKATIIMRYERYGREIELEFYKRRRDLDIQINGGVIHNYSFKFFGLLRFKMTKLINKLNKHQKDKKDREHRLEFEEKYLKLFPDEVDNILLGVENDS